MCDTSNVLSNVFSELNLPGVETVGKIERFADRATPLFKAGFESYGAIAGEQSAQRKAGVRSAQVAFGADIEGKQTAQMQERRLGANRAAFAKLGVKQTGTARRLLEEQAKQDDIELLKIKHNKDIALSNIATDARNARRKRQQEVASAFGKKEVLTSITDIFGL